MSKKIYLCKSNMCNPDQVARVRNQINEIDGIELLEYVGGQYNPNLIKQGEAIIMVPPLGQPEEAGKAINVGRGQYSEIESNMEVPSFVYNEADNTLRMITKGERNEKGTEWKKDYGYIHYKEEGLPFVAESFK